MVVHEPSSVLVLADTLATTVDGESYLDEKLGLDGLFEARSGDRRA